MEENNINVISFASEMSELLGVEIGVSHIHPSSEDEGRFFYIQPPKAGAPMILHHYRGPFCIDIHPDDYKKIETGEISVREYIISANWQVGYYWGGGSMIGGGYYQPIDIIGKNDEVRRYLQILSCRGYYKSSCGYKPSRKACEECSVENCPFSDYKKGNWENEMEEYDPRIDFYKSLRLRFEQENIGYTLHGFSCGKLPDNEIWLSPNGHYHKDTPFTFTAYASYSTIRSLLMREVDLENLKEYVDSFNFRIHKMFSHQTHEVNPENLEKAFERMDYAKEEVDTQPELPDEESVPLIDRIVAFFKRF